MSLVGTAIFFIVTKKRHRRTKSENPWHKPELPSAKSSKPSARLLESGFPEAEGEHLANLLLREMEGRDVINELPSAQKTRTVHELGEGEGKDGRMIACETARVNVCHLCKTYPESKRFQISTACTVVTMCHRLVLAVNISDVQKLCKPKDFRTFGDTALKEDVIIW